MTTRKKKSPFRNSIHSSLDNAERLLDDATWLDIESSAPTVYALCILAQEEFAKAFILYLIDSDCLPWSPEIRKMLRNHSCKQLFGLILDFLEPDTEDFLARSQEWLDYINKCQIGRPAFPAHVADAINIIRHEKVNRYRTRNEWLYENDKPCDQVARKIGDGYLDGLKLNAIYVDIGMTGEVISTPLRIKPDDAKIELAKTDRFRRFLFRSEGEIIAPSGLEFERVSAAFKLVFGRISVEDYQEKWGS